MQTHQPQGTRVEIFALAVATAFWCVAVMLMLLAHLHWESVLWAALSRVTMYFSAGLASAAALHLFIRRRPWQRMARTASAVPDLGSATIGMMMGTAWFFLIVPSNITMPTLALLALIGTLVGFEARDQGLGPINPSMGRS